MFPSTRCLVWEVLVTADKIVADHAVHGAPLYYGVQK